MIAIKSFNKKKSVGDDHMTVIICEYCFKSQPEIITKIYNLCLELRYFPKKWKIAKIRLIPKPMSTGEEGKPNYRPIGLLPVLSKVLERMIHTRLMWKIYQDNLISICQYGFMPTRSSENALERIMNQIKSALQNKKRTLLISIDIKGAFNNTCWPEVIWQLKTKFGYNNLTKLVESYLNDRFVTIDYGEQIIKWKMERGCIQGSVLGPLMWNLVVNEILDNRNVQEYITAYADDITLVISGKTEKELYNKAQRTLDEVSKWAQKNKLTFSKNKTFMVRMDRSKQTLEKSLKN